MTVNEYCFWLIPAKPLETQLADLIGKLATEYGAVPFTPHVTLYVGPSNDAEARAIADGVAEQFAPLKLKFEKLNHTDSFYKTLFAQFAESAEAREISDFIKTACASPSAYALRPHLSLMYKKMPASARTPLCQTLDMPRGIYAFDRLRVVETGTGQNDETVRQWRTVCDKAL